MKSVIFQNDLYQAKSYISNCFNLLKFHSQVPVSAESNHTMLVEAEVTSGLANTAFATDSQKQEQLIPDGPVEDILMMISGDAFTSSPNDAFTEAKIAMLDTCHRRRLPPTSFSDAVALRYSMFKLGGYFARKSEVASKRRA